jgi:hypothetical protein
MRWNFSMFVWRRSPKTARVKPKSSTQFVLSSLRTDKKFKPGAVCLPGSSRIVCQPPVQARHRQTSCPPKPGKDDYTYMHAFRPISLMPFLFAFGRQQSCLPKAKKALFDPTLKVRFHHQIFATDSLTHSL